MKNTKKLLSLFLSAVLLLGCLPLSVAAADVVPVIGTYIVQTSATIAVSGTALTATAYPDATLDDIKILTSPATDYIFMDSQENVIPKTASVNGLGTIYVRFPSGAAPGEYTVSIYSLSFNLVPKPPAISNVTLPGQVMAGSNKTLTAADFGVNASENIISVKVEKPKQGSLTYNGTPVDVPATISILGGQFASALVYTAPSSGTSDTDTIDFTFYKDNSPLPDSWASAKMTIGITGAINLPTISGSITKSISAGATASFTSSDFTSKANLNNGSLVSVTITPKATTSGTWKFKGSNVGSSVVVPASEISDLKFEGNTTIGSAAFDWKITNEAGSSTATGSGTISVGMITLTAYEAPSANAVAKGSVWSAAASHFVYSPTSAAIKFVKINSVPSSSDGTLTVTGAIPAGTGYPAIAANTALSNGAIIPADKLGTLRLNTKSTSTSSYISFSWTATTETAISGSTTWPSAVNYRVPLKTSAQAFTLSVGKNGFVRFNESDFAKAFSDFTGGTSLKHVIFTLPNTSQGRLYYDYSSSSNPGSLVQSGRTYGHSAAGSAPYRINNVTFVPAADYTGTVTINYKATGTDSKETSGVLTIKVGSSVSGGTITYNLPRNDKITLNADDFRDAFKNSSGGLTLSYINFETIPSSSYGTLYYKYTSASNYESAVNKTTDYFVSGSKDPISSITFVAGSNTGTVSVTFRGYTSNGSSMETGTVRFVIGTSSSTLDLSFNIAKNERLKFTGADFYDVLRSSRNRTLSYIRFTTLPSSSQGKLYYNYTSSSSTGSSVGSSDNYNYSGSNQISNVSFVPATGYTGTVSIPYRAYDTSGDYYTGTITITVGSGTAKGDVSYTVARNSALTLSASDFNSAYNDRMSGTLNYIRFSELPSSSRGTFYYNYTSSSNYGSKVDTSTRYYRNSSSYIASVTFVPYNNYTGTVEVEFMAYGTDGDYYTGTLKITVGTGNMPTLSNGYKTTPVNTTVNFTAADFNSLYTRNGGSSIEGITITALPNSTYGTLFLNNTALTVNYYVPATSFNLIKFVPAKDKTGSCTFSFTATDGTNVTSAATMTITIGAAAAAGNAPIITSFKADDVRTSSRSVGITLSAYVSSQGNPSQMAFAFNGGAFGAWQSYSTSANVTLPSDEGIHTISVKVKSSTGTESSVSKTRIIYDTSAPVVIATTINESRNVVWLDFSEPIGYATTSLTFKDRFYFTDSSGGDTLYLTDRDSISLSGSSLKITLNSSLASRYTRAFISRNTVADVLGNEISRDLTLTMKGEKDYTFSTSANSLTFPAASADNSGYATFCVDTFAASDIIARAKSGSTLKIFLPVSGGNVTGRTLHFASGFLTSSTVGKIPTIVVTDGTAEVSIDTKQLRAALIDPEAPFSLVISTVSLTDVPTAAKAGIARGIWLYNSGFQMDEIPGRNTIRIMLPYTSAGSGDRNTAIIYRRHGASSYIPICTSRFNYSSKSLWAPVSRSGVCVSGINRFSFNDITKTNSIWAQEHIDFLSSRGVINGMGNGVFAGSSQLKKNEYIKMLVIALDIYDEGANCALGNVTPNDWAYYYIASAVKAGIIPDSGSFPQFDNISREEMALYAYNAALYIGVNFEPVNSVIDFTDKSSISASCSTAVSVMQRAGIIDGYPDKSFKPKATCQRDAATKIVSLIMQRED